MRARTLGAALLLTALVAACAEPRPPVPLPIPRPSAYASPAPDGPPRRGWDVVHTVEVPDGWTRGDQQVDRSHESTVWRPVSREDVLCGTGVWAPGALDQEPSGGQDVVVQGRPGQFFPDEPGPDESLDGLWWRYRRDAWASLSCTGLGAADHLAMADRVRFRPTRYPMPYRLRSMPPGYRVSYLSTRTEAGATTYVLALENLGEDEFPMAPDISLGPPPPTPDPRSLCLPQGPQALCVGGGLDSNPPEPDGDARLRARLQAVADVLEVAPDLADRGTWFGGDDVPG